ncbi:uncharacterized protein LOC130712816 [Lotus japonicus]|uniref:uncharacterized protein LOC130712816 n=1 Tax=Lotus japonicus TaxID=34305 RepID=UPI002584FE75|nr:uncharacterized protein LOC130712816 [Lotus japonicus]
MRIISSVKLVRGKKDSWCWIKEENGINTVSSAYEELMDFVNSDEDVVFRYLWASLASSNAIALGWRVLIDCIQTGTNLLRRNVAIDSSICPLCLQFEESTNHLFFSCLVLWQIWALVENWLGWSMVLSASAKEHLQQFVCVGSGSVRKGLLVVWLATVWHLWVGRNGKTFRGEDVQPIQIFEQIKLKAWLWLRAKHRNFRHAILECCFDLQDYLHVGTFSWSLVTGIFVGWLAAGWWNLLVSLSWIKLVGPVMLHWDGMFKVSKHFVMLAVQ